MVSPPDSAGKEGRDWQEILVTVLLVAAALATSWSSYQATQWHGHQAIATSRTNAIRIDAAKEQGQAEAQTQVDVATFIAWSEADQRGEAKVADYFEQRFRDEFRTAYDAWIATDPFTNAEAPETPFAMDAYQVAARQEAARLNAEAEVSAGETLVAIQRASNYVLSVVLYAVVLFFAGMSARLSHRRLRWVLTVSGAAVLLGALIWVATLPVSFSA